MNILSGDSQEVQSQVGFKQTAKEAGRLTFELASTVPSPFPDLSGKELSVGPGEYKLLDGSDDPISVNSGQLHIFKDGGPEYYKPLPGVHFRGWYEVGRGAQPQQIVSFLYHKLDAAGELETAERAIIWRGTGYGEHPGHKGQSPTWYLVGPQIGTFNHQTGKLISLDDADNEILAKNFSVACITNGPWGEPVLANPLQQ